MIPTSAQNGCDQVTRLIVQPSVGSPDYGAPTFRKKRNAQVFSMGAEGGCLVPRPSSQLWIDTRSS